LEKIYFVENMINKLIKYLICLMVLMAYTGCQTNLPPISEMEETNAELKKEYTKTSLPVEEETSIITTEGNIDIVPSTMSPLNNQIYTAIPAHTAIVGTPVEAKNDNRPLSYCEKYGFQILEALQKQGVIFHGGGGGGGNENECGMNFEGLRNIEDITLFNRVVNDVFAVDNWVEDKQAAAGGPIGEVIGFKKENERCIFRYEWQFPKDGRCPTDRPIGDCEIPQKEKVYILSLACQHFSEDSKTPTPLMSIETKSP